MSDIERAQRAVVMLAGGVADIRDPRDANAILCGMICAGLVGHIPDEQWRQMMSVRSRPCGTAGCDCHIQTAALLEALDEEREKYKEKFPARFPKSST